MDALDDIDLAECNVVQMRTPDRRPSMHSIGQDVVAKAELCNATSPMASTQTQAKMERSPSVGDIVLVDDEKAADQMTQDVKEFAGCRRCATSGRDFITGEPIAWAGFSGFRGLGARTASIVGASCFHSSALCWSSRFG